MWISWVVPICICALFALVEGLLSGPHPVQFLRSLNQPQWVMPMPAWIAIGASFYAISAFVLHRLFQQNNAELPIALTILMLVGNALWNFLFFRLRRLDLAFAYLVPYSALIIALMVTAWLVDRASAVAIGLYVLFLPYDFAWVMMLWRMNGRHGAHSC